MFANLRCLFKCRNVSSLPVQKKTVPKAREWGCSHLVPWSPPWNSHISCWLSQGTILHCGRKVSWNVCEMLVSCPGWRRMGLGAEVGASGLYPWTNLLFWRLWLTVSSSPLQIPDPAPFKVIRAFLLHPYISVPPVLREVGSDISCAMMCFFHQW